MHITANKKEKSVGKTQAKADKYKGRRKGQTAGAGARGYSRENTGRQE